ncbi:hypothetical protein FT663_02536 [Candidozyma haemuli var. vulneris]|uniref:serine--tRNA ligase n=1 Tax=Candidozyma haemuli TaxID=45357 RepID=A0A2V1AN11_9ASCO|nr:serine-tRNA ligase [[Candida] haemuloni]KAF3989710.1 hypothetical protein FT662_02685 [[Candida] haemuloni var. vulneris]KAF3991914.1 hypothetical protein FT663_02536 [[Candida] haemuloni var. vulneris]PVH19084.1 serine-tRNA ligase [[Candida] haemuloni]
MKPFRTWSRCLSSFKSTTTLKKPILDVKGIIAQSEDMKHVLRRRGLSHADLEFILDNRDKERELQRERDQLVKERKQGGSRLAELKSRGATEAEIAELQKSLGSLKPTIASLEGRLSQLSELIHKHTESLPNWLDGSVPSDPDVPEVHSIINEASEESIISSLPVTSMDHKAIAEKLNIVNFTVASRISGSSWYYLVGDGALLEQALVQYALSKARQSGYTMVIPPSIVKNEITHACGFKPRDQNDEKQVYELEGESLSLTGTAEIPMGALHSSSTMSEDQLPAKYVGVSRSYRAEAGANGKDTTGLYRVHEFTKVELFHFTTPDKSVSELEELREFQTSIIKDLGIKAKMLNMPTTDLGAPAVKKYDCEAWMPGRGGWGELTSSSNCTDYQSRRLGIRYKTKEGFSHIHTLNGTAMAVPRMIVAILEQNYDSESNAVVIPDVLRPYMDGKKVITQN